MGRIVRRFARFFEQEMRGNLKIGEWTAAAVIGITQYEAGQRLFEICLEATALGGAARAAYISCQATVALTGTLAAIHARTQVPTAIVVTGSTYGIYIEQELVGTGNITAAWEGIRLDMWSNSGVAVGGAIRAIHVVNDVATHPTGPYELMRLSKHGAALCDVGILIECGVAGDMTYAFEFQGTPVAAWSPVTTPPGAIVGRVAVLCHGVPLWIALHN